VAVVRRLPKGYWTALGIGILLALAGASDTFLLLFGSKLGYSDVALVGCYLIYNLTYTLTSYPAGRWSDRIGRWWVLALGWVLYTCVYLGFSWTTPFWLPGLFAAYGVSVGLTQGVGSALIADFSPVDSRGTAMGLYHMATGLGLLVASAGFGWLWGIASIGPRGAFQVVGSIAAAGTLCIVWLALTRRPTTRQRMGAK
jgi:MFS family permease